jgi:hypothetical protein
LLETSEGMPSQPFECQGPAAIGRFLSTVPVGGELERIPLVPTRANGRFGLPRTLRD